MGRDQFKAKVQVAMLLLCMVTTNMFVKPYQVSDRRQGRLSPSLETVERHSKEVLGKLPRALSERSWQIQELEEVVYGIIMDEVGASNRHQAQVLFDAVMSESHRYDFDPLFLLAIIKTESRFNSKARGRHGEIGLMQMLPKTAEWISKKNGWHWRGPESLTDDRTNIQLGAAYLASLRARFDCHSTYYLAAYNMGTTNVLRLMSRAVRPKQYTLRVVGNYLGFYKSVYESSLIASRQSAEKVSSAL